MTNQEIRQLFQDIRVWQQGGKRAPHKPLLLLLAISRAIQGEVTITEYSAIDSPLKSLLQKFGPSSGPASRHYPFWHLGTDFDGTLWQLDGPKEILERPPGKTPTLTELRDLNIRGGLAPKIRERLQRDIRLAAEVIGILLYTHFPATLHEDILAEVEIPARFILPPVHEFDRQEYRRDSTVRQRILKAYNYRCCICNHDLRIADRFVGLEAAHIKWVQMKGPHEIRNGLALCSTHHKMFDYGVFTIDPKAHYVLFSQNANASGPTAEKLLSYHGAPIISPQKDSHRPASAYLEWHRDEVFKKPARGV